MGYDLGAGLKLLGNNKISYLPPHAGLRTPPKMANKYPGIQVLNDPHTPGRRAGVRWLSPGLGVEFLRLRVHG